VPGGETQGEVGFRALTKRPDNQGYLTTYTVPADLFRAHQVISITGHWQQARTSAELQETWGKPHEVLERPEGQRYRYWVIQYEGKMPLAALAVDFDMTGSAKAPTCHTFAVHTTGVDFVQQRLDALVEQWQRVYVID